MFFHFMWAWTEDKTTGERKREIETKLTNTANNNRENKYTTIEWTRDYLLDWDVVRDFRKMVDDKNRKLLVYFREYSCYFWSETLRYFYEDLPNTNERRNWYNGPIIIN